MLISGEPNLGDKVHIFVKELGLGGDAAQYDTNEDTRKRRNVADTITSKSRVTRHHKGIGNVCLLYTSPSPRDRQKSRMPSSA